MASLRWVAALFAIAALTLTGMASATSAATEGVHGTAIQKSLNWRLGVNVNRTTTDTLVGSIHFFVFDTPLIERAHIEAQAIELVIADNTACVVGEVSRFSGDIGYTPVFVVVNVRDVEGRPDLFSVIVFPSDFIGELPPTCADAIPTTNPADAGNFTIVADP